MHNSLCLFILTVDLLHKDISDCVNLVRYSGVMAKNPN